MNLKIGKEDQIIKEMNIQEHIRKVLREDVRLREFIRNRIDMHGLYKTSKMLGYSEIDLIRLAGIKIDHKLAGQLLKKSLLNGKITSEYKEFDISTNYDGVFYWEGKINTGHFLPGMTEAVSVMATPFWDGSDYTPIEISWFSLYNEDMEMVIEEEGMGDYYTELKSKTYFDSVEELFEWYNEIYLPSVYDVVINKLLPKVHQYIDDKLDERMGY
jgi:hypothetical protein